MDCTRGLTIYELTPPETLLDEDQQQSLLYSSDLELGETTRRIFEAVAQAQPPLLVLDSLSEIRLLAQGSLRYHRQILDRSQPWDAAPARSSSSVSDRVM